MPPDEELVDLIEQAFLEGQIDGVKADMAYLWLLRRSGGEIKHYPQSVESCPRYHFRAIYRQPIKRLHFGEAFCVWGRVRPQNPIPLSERHGAQQSPQISPSFLNVFAGSHRVVCDVATGS